jgi:Cryptococcal mannosyltransferase 1
MSNPLRRKVAVCALFRNSAAYIDYFRAVMTAQARDHIELVFSLVEGDSTDDSYARLQAWAAADSRVTLSKVDVEPVTDFADRVSKWAMLGNVAVEQALATDCTHVLWCESDLVLPFDLLDQLLAEPADIVAPAIFLGTLFYDTWGFRGLDGTRFSNEAPYHREFRHHARVPLNSVGSCVLFRRELFDQGVRFRGSYDDGLLVGVCRDAAALGFQTYMDSRIAIVHPTSLWKRQQYTLGAVDVQCFRAENQEILARAAQRVVSDVRITIGSVDMSGDHPVFAPVHDIMRAHFTDTPFAVRLRLASERDKQYALILSDLPAPRVLP